MNHNQSSDAPVASSDAIETRELDSYSGDIPVPVLPQSEPLEPATLSSPADEAAIPTDEAASPQLSTGPDLPQLGLPAATHDWPMPAILSATPPMPAQMMESGAESTEQVSFGGNLNGNSRFSPLWLDSYFEQGDS